MPTITKNIYPAQVICDDVDGDFGGNVVAPPFNTYHNETQEYSRGLCNVKFVYSPDDFKNASSIGISLKASNVRENFDTRYIEGEKKFELLSNVNSLKTEPSGFPSGNITENIEITPSIKEKLESIINTGGNIIIYPHIYVKNCTLKNSGGSEVYAAGFYIRFSTNPKDHCIEIAETVPSISSLSVVGTSIDENITCNFEIVDCDFWKIEAIISGETVAYKTGTFERTCVFNVGEISSYGNCKFKLTAFYSENSVTQSEDVVLTGTQVSIVDLEPNGINQLKTSNINISFSGTNISTYSIYAKQDGIVKWSKEGTSSDGTVVEGVQKFSFSMVKNLFSTGNVTLELTCNYVGPYYSNTAKETATFLVYGAPSAPTIVAQETYTTPTPEILFSCTESYISYQVEIDGTVSTETYGSPNKYRCDVLENNKTHIFKVRVKNQYQLWSEWSIVNFLVSYTELQTPIINAYAENASIVINIESPSQVRFHYHSVLRSEDGLNWTVIATDLVIIDTFKDSTVASGVEYIYKARAVDVDGGIKDSDFIRCTCNFRHTVLSVPFTNTSVVLKYYADQSSGAERKIGKDNEHTYFDVCGLTLPKAQVRKKKTKTMQLNIAFKTKAAYEEFTNLEDEEVILFRDKRGIKMYCDMVITEEQYMQSYYKAVSATFNEIYYKEGDYIEAPEEIFTFTRSEF